MEKGTIKRFMFKAIIVSIFMLIVGFGLMDAVDNSVNNFLNRVEPMIENAKEVLTCEINYKSTHYKGICNEEVYKSFNELVGFDKELELLNFCMKNNIKNITFCRNLI